MWASFPENHKDLSFGCRCIFYIGAVNNITRVKYELLRRSLHILGKDGVSSGNAECTLVKRGGKILLDVMDLGVCTREKLTHVRDCKTGTQSSCYFFNVTKKYCHQILLKEF